MIWNTSSEKREFVIAGHSASEDARERAYDPAIHRFERSFLRRRWTRGSSPRVTQFRVIDWIPRAQE